MLYYSPEIINGQGYTGPEVDCWCLGVSLYRMTVGEEPFSRANSKFQSIYACQTSGLLILVFF
jgi:hypothetical protein